MPGESIHHKKKGRKYNVLIVPSDDAGRRISFNARPWLLGVMLALVFLVTGAITFMTLNYTPLALVLPVTNPILEQKYGRQIVALQEKLSKVTSDVLLLQSYNDKLRRVLGDDTKPDSSATAQGVPSESQKGSYQMEEERLPVESAAGDPQPIGSVTTTANTAPRPVTTHEVRNGDVNLPLSFPTEGFITRTFDAEKRHFGIDIAGKTGTPVYAAADGHVIFAGWTVDDGNMVIIAHTNGFVTFYKHNQTLLTGNNVFIKRGEPIALLGNSGKTSLGPHLHFEMWYDGLPHDPDGFFLNAKR
jgi:murein DD-endopeptidase MepM/ murein hydrolase activator NlpD